MPYLSLLVELRSTAGLFTCGLYPGVKEQMTELKGTFEYYFCDVGILYKSSTQRLVTVDIAHKLCLPSVSTFSSSSLKSKISLWLHPLANSYPREAI